MTQIEQAIAQIEQLKEENKHKLGACAAQIAMEGHCKEEAYNEAIEILKTLANSAKSSKNLQEPTSPCDTCEGNNLPGTCASISSLGRCPLEYNREPASEDLEQASIEHANKIHNDTAPGERIAACRYDFKAGAQWQKEKDQKELQIAEEHGILTGMNMEHEKLMKDAVDAVVSQVPCANEIIFRNPASVNYWYLPSEMNRLGLNKGDKVKLIIVKDE